jgi:hypothetical protein
MSWDRKRSDERRYYYRSLWLDGRTVKEYVGTGPLAELAARMDDLERQERFARQVAWFEEQERLAVPESLLNEVRLLAGLLTRATLLLRGYHRHKGEWRRRRGVHGRTHDGDVSRAPGQAETVARGANPEGQPDEATGDYRRHRPQTAGRASTRRAHPGAGPGNAPAPASAAREGRAPGRQAGGQGRRQGTRRPAGALPQ